MKLKNRLAMLGAAALVLIFLIYLGYQISNNLTEQILTVDAIEVTVEDQASVEGAFLRSQTPIYADNVQGWGEYLVEDGDKVAKGQKIAVFFATEDAARQYRDCEDLRDRLSALEYAYESITGGADSARMEELIWRQIVESNQQLVQGNADLSDSGLAQLEQLVVSRSASKKDKEQFEVRIADLRAELAEKERALSAHTSAICAPVSGYFFSTCDGYGTLLSDARVDELTPEELLKSELPPDTAAKGCIVHSFEWYYAALIDREKAQELQGRSRAEVCFPEISSDRIIADIRELRPVSDEHSMLILHSDLMAPAYLSTRRELADVTLNTYTGLKVPTEALRQIDGVWGVYVLDGSVARFKPVHWNYQAESFFLVPCAETSAQGLYHYDKIITRAKGLADNKVMK